MERDGELLDAYSQAVIHATEVAGPAVVQVRTRQAQSAFFGLMPLRQGLGSGVVIDGARGRIITNSHVVAGSEGVEVGLQDGRRGRARVKIGRASCRGRVWRWVRVGPAKMMVRGTSIHRLAQVT